MTKWALPVTLLVLLAVTSAGPAFAALGAAQQENPPFGLPFADPPGPSTWLLVQAYGNTTGAYRQRNTTYRAGQGLHFGLDLSARCGTPVVAAGDGIVSEVDAAFHGSAPHNLMINHPKGYATFYGHLLERPALQPGDPIQRGQVVALSGDPDLTCNSRPHLHFEIRDAASHTRAYNPILLIDANWDAIAVAGAQSFARDLSDPRRWQYLDDQPEVQFGGALLNDFATVWPPVWPGNR